MPTIRVEWINLSVGQPYDGGGANVIGGIVGSAVALAVGATATEAAERPSAPAGARYARVTAIGGNVIATAGTDPVAAGDNGLVVPEGTSELLPVSEGDLLSFLELA